jgi:hypothetical protein
MLFALLNATTALASPSSSPDDDPLYYLIGRTAPGDVLLSDNTAPDGISGGGVAIVTKTENSYIVDYGITNVIATVPNSNPVPNDVYYSTAVIMNDTSEIWELDMSQPFEALLWIYIIENKEPKYNTYEYYQQVMDEWMIFQFSVAGPDGDIQKICPYSTVTDFAGNGGYKFPDETNSHIYPPVSLDGDYYAKAPIPITEPVILEPGESMSVSWNFGVAWEADNGIMRMSMDFNFRLRFIQPLSNPTPTPTPEPTPTPTPEPTPTPTPEPHSKPTPDPTPASTPAPWSIPRTGDDSSLSYWILFMSAGAAGLAGTVAWSRRSRKHKARNRKQWPFG